MATEEVNKPPPPPSYPQMIINAIEALNEKNGSNKTSICKYLESKYDMPAGHTGLLSHYLYRMKEDGELIFWKNNYMKADDPNAPPRRGRGRPPKPKVPLPPGVVLSPSRPRGRPPKDPNAPPRSPKPKMPSGTGKPRGRPRKMARPEGGIGGSSATMMAGPVRPRGRPPKVNASALTEVSVEH
ncbi:hypothetical protein DITRI_Ditri13aG0163200 [Diplodiscus trichospermus]